MAFNQDFATTTCSPPLLLEELEADPLPLTTAIDSVEYFPATDLTRITWNVTPSGAEQTAASDVVTAHVMSPMQNAETGTKVKSRSITAPPADPKLRDAYIVAATATGDWAGMEDHVAVWDGKSWGFFQETMGITAFVVDEALTVQFDTTGVWTAIAAQRNINATAAPTATDDASEGYSVGSHWVDVSADKAYICVDSTVDAAVWNSPSVTAHDLAGVEHNADTLADLNAKVSDATLDDASAARTPTAHTHPNTDLTGVPGAGVDTAAIHDDTGGEINAVAAKATPVDADVVLIEDSAAAFAKKKVTVGSLPDPTSDIAEATGDTTTTSATDVLANSMTLTPASGTYLVRFTGSVDHSSSNAVTEMSIYSGGAQVAASERRFQRGAGQGNVASAFCCEAKVTVNGSQAIEGQWRTDGSTATMHERTLTILKVA